MKIIYISGKITGLDLNEAKKLFQEAEDYLKGINSNYVVVNPMKLVPYEGSKTWKQYMIEDIELLFDCDTIFLLNNWKESKGARIEFNIALELDKNILFQSI